MEFPEARIIVFAKAPVLGQVKTRLAGHLGNFGAALLHRQLLSHTLRRLTQARLAPVELWCAPDTQHGFFIACRRDYGIPLRRQQGCDLGERMAHALATVLQEGSPYAVIVGSDCPMLDATYLRHGLMALRTGQDAVLGPTEDDGYMLIGLRRSCPALFKGIRWGGPEVLAATRRRLQRGSLSWSELPLAWDVDRPADLRRLRQQKIILFYQPPS
jgi:rSAM/selenodomain-associated transferase 1